MISKNYKTGSSNIIMSDYPDLDVIRVDDVYYMVSTTMHLMPGCVILKSYNLLDWEFCSYVYDELDGTSAQKLENNQGIYGKGMWAACLRFHNNKFYVSFVCNDTHKSYLYTADSITGPWKKSEIPGFYHDMSILFDDDDKVYIVSGNTQIYLTEMEKDLSAPKKDGLNKLIVKEEGPELGLGYEGSHIYKINGKYYIFFIHIPKNKMRTQACFVADKIEGPYHGVDVLYSDLGNWNSGVAQGGIVQQNDGKWFGILFQDHGALGRIPVLVPVNFDNDFPVFGQNGIAPESVTVLDNNPSYSYKPLFGSNITCSKGKLESYWQWNHIPDLSKVHILDNQIQIESAKVVTNIVQAANVLTQRTYTEHCASTVTVDASKISEGDFTGLCAFEGEYAFIGITKLNGKFQLVVANHKSKNVPWAMGVFDSEAADILFKKDIQNPSATLKLEFDLTRENQFVKLSCFDEEKKEFINLTEPLKLRYTLDHFVGVRIALFIFSTKQTGGKTCFNNFDFKLL